MTRLIIAIGFGMYLASPAYAQQCLHGPDETADQQARRRQGLSAARAVNTLEANQPGAANGGYLRQEELAAAPSPLKQSEPVSSFNFTPGQELLPGWELKLDVSEHGYWFMIEDKTDPCGFAYISNNLGVIYTAEPLR